jgi:hypothetical protein
MRPFVSALKLFKERDPLDLMAITVTNLSSVKRHFIYVRIPLLNFLEHSALKTQT